MIHWKLLSALIFRQINKLLFVLHIHCCRLPHLFHKQPHTLGDMKMVCSHQNLEKLIFRYHEMRLKNIETQAQTWIQPIYTNYFIIKSVLVTNFYARSTRKLSLFKLLLFTWKRGINNIWLKAKKLFVKEFMFLKFLCKNTLFSKQISNDKNYI